MPVSEQERHEMMSRAFTAIRLREPGFGDDRAEATFYGSFEIVADDGRVLYSLRLDKDGNLEVAAGGYATHNEVLLTDQVAVRSCGSNRVLISRDAHRKEGGES